MNKKEIEKKVVDHKYSEDEIEYRGWLLRRLTTARDQRDQPHTEFDGQTYLQYWESNAKAAFAYIAPKINREDVRVTTGTTLEKKNTLLSALLNLNFDVDIEAFDDEDRVIVELGTAMEDLIKKSKKLEPIDADTKRAMIYSELLAQGDVVVEDTNMEIKIPQRDLKNMGTTLDEVTWTDRLDKSYKYLTTNVIAGPNVYFGNIREFFLENQPFIFIRTLIPREEAFAVYGTWERWESVPTEITKMSEDAGDSLAYHNWTLGEIEKDKVEVIKYYDKWNNNYMLLLNGVMMFPVKKNKGRFNTVPLSALTGECDYPLAKGSIEPISPFFAYSKSIPSKTKVDQQIFDEMFKAIVVKTRKSYQPPLANNTGVNISRKIYHPANITKGIDPSKLQEIGQNTGVTGPEFNAVQWIKGIIDEKSVAPIMQGQQQGGQQTAREIQAQLTQAKIRIGVAILGVINLEKRLAQLRLWNILKHWTQPIDSKLEQTKEGITQVINKYQKITVDTELDEGIKGKRIIQFQEGEHPTGKQVDAEDELLSKKYNQPVRKFIINPKLLTQMKYHWYIEIISTEKDTSQLKLAMFEESLQKILTIFLPAGKQANMDHLADKWAVLAGMNPEKVWAQAQPQLPQGGGEMPQGGPPQQGGPNLAQQLTGGQALPRPTVNTMAQA